MEEITTNTKMIELTGEEIQVYFSSAFPYFWLRNDGSGTVLMSVSPNIEEGKDGVIEVLAGSSAGTMHGYNATATDLYLLGTGKVQIMATYSPENPFRKARKGGDGNVISSYISNGLVYQSGGDYKNICTFSNVVNLEKSATVEFCGVYTSIPSTDQKGRWFDFVEYAKSNTFSAAQYDDILEIFYGKWFAGGQTGITIVPNEYVTISAVCNDTSMSLYKNGIFVDIFDTTDYPQELNVKEISFMHGLTTSNRELNGSLKSLRIYNRTLTENEILHNANADKFMYF